ncbi:hypothetical protein PHYSODRAFT_528227 [Phytophthora sojae]|uniref:RanBP2-type domain-containing protein n=1 Tax=Phytophthora sojae (strain P6497) TaxID=1094619 RepID=G5AAN6_PHYSP|nr:hypothetical protein PHYSODRAFT_528227 [Phytophthora sojae]EGZ07665.1 hypothetical protein PHYSODRAFT_528227 [Phytophthora sojae]|eukprot:XP_009537231.1 hypothetical protein PHYSODRAFT_528227 [Phytophthora sojae]
MSWVVAENTPTATVVWMAAELIGKAQNHEQLQRICDYLVNKHWFQTAADLRSARRETTEWQALEVPGRLKLAIQQVLDQTTPHQEPFSTFGYEDYYAAVRPSISSEGEAATQSWSDATAAYGADHETYCNSSATSGYNESGAAATTLLSLQSSSEQVLLDDSDVVEAQVIDAEVAEECVEAEAAEVTPEQPQDMYAEPALQDRPQLDARDTVGTWSCGQCTYMNPMTSSFCEMCIGHISLSPDVKTTAGTSVSASLLIPAKPVVDVEMTSPRVEPSTDMRSPQPSVTCMLPSVASLYSPSAPDYEMCEDERVDSTPLPPPPPYPGTSSCGNVDFLALAFSGSSAPKTQALESPPAAKASQMRCEEATTITEYTF